MSENANSRLLLRPWLERKIESGLTPGLYWLDKSKKIFRISWKRNGTSEWAEEHSAIFRDWAIHTGKFREGIDKIDYPYWKTRLRCALKKHSEIKECINLNNLEGSDPYRVYQISDNSTYNEPLPTQENNLQMEVDDFPLQMNMDMDNMQISGSLDSDLRNISSSELIDISSEEFRRVQYEEFRRLQYDFEVIIRFQSKEMSCNLVKEGCFLTKDCTAHRKNDYEVISFPDISPDTEEIQAITSVLWPNLKDGIYIIIDANRNIIAKRLCKCRIYYCDQNNQNGLKLHRSDGSTSTLIFDYQQFLEDFGKHNPSIKADVTLYIGQKGDMNPYDFSKVICSVTICHLQAKQCLTKRNTKVHKVSISI